MLFNRTPVNGGYYINCTSSKLATRAIIIIITKTTTTILMAIDSE